MRKMRRTTIMALLLDIALLFSVMLIPVSVNAVDPNLQLLETKVYSVATINDAFATDSIVVVLDKSKSVINREHKKSEFSGVNIDHIEDQTTITGNVADKKYLNREGFHQILNITLTEKSKENVLKTIKILQSDPNIKYVGPNYIIRIAATPNDPFYGNQWGLPKISAPDAWDIVAGSNSVLVGVIDTGIDAAHPEFSGRINTSLGRNFINEIGGTTDPNKDSNGHGTHVAGIIGATGNNSIGVVGVCWTVTMVSLRAFDEYGFGYTSSVVDAINYAQNSNIPILNYSAGSDVYNPALEAAINNYSGIFVCAAGNDTKNNDTSPNYPSNFACANLISVGSSDSDDNRSNFSNYGKKSVDIFAPGSNIYSTYPDNSYKYMSGTSMATPFVTGVAALIKSAYPSLTSVQVKNLILDNVDITSGFRDICVSGGRLNAYKAIQANNNNRHLPIGSFDLLTADIGIIAVHGWAFDDDLPTTALQIHVYFGGPAGSAGAEFQSLGAANISRPDVGATYPGRGNNHGFSKIVQTTKTGTQTVYVYAVNIDSSGKAGGTNVLLGSKTVNIPSPTPTNNYLPIGSFDLLTAGIGIIAVHGWAFDDDLPTTALQIHVYIGGPAGSAGAEFQSISAEDIYRPDVGATYPGRGDYHGFSKEVPTTKTGTQTVYVYAVNIDSSGKAGGTNVLLGSKTVNIPSPTNNYLPIGCFDLLTADIGIVAVHGWAFDDDLPTAAVEIHVYIGVPSGSAGAECQSLGVANISRPDVGAAYLGRGNNHGFSKIVPTNKKGTQTVYVYAINIDSSGKAGGTNVLIGSKTVDIP